MSLTVSSHILKATKNLIEKNILPKYDGSYLDDETNQWHDTYVIESATAEQIYILDMERETGITVCTCQADDYRKYCKHIHLLNASIV